MKILPAETLEGFATCFYPLSSSKIAIPTRKSRAALVSGLHLTFFFGVGRDLNRLAASELLKRSTLLVKLDGGSPRG